jgi:hypothetical protein
VWSVLRRLSDGVAFQASINYGLEKRMKTHVAFFLTLVTVFGFSRAAGQEKRKQLPMVHMSGLLGLVETIPLPTDGWMDHLTVDLKNQHLFISGEYSKSFVIVDL